LAKKYVDVVIKKEVRETFSRIPKKLTEEQLRYGALDTLILFPIFEAQIPLLKKEGLIKTARLEFAVTTVISEMELKGMYINEKKWRDIIKRLKKERNKFARQLQDIVRPYYSLNQVDIFGNMADVININSQVQLMDLFNNRLNLSIPSTGDAVLATVDHPAAKKLREYRKYEKLISAFGDTLLSKINKKTNRIHPDFIQLGAATGRFACANPNLQQIPRGDETETPFRSCFNPEPGYKFIVADYSSFEMRIMAELSSDRKMIDALNNGLDIHSYTASLMFNKEYSDDFRDKYPDLRQISKPIGFGLMYGMGPLGLAGRLEVSPDMSRDYMNRYFKSYPGVKR
jgi:DNA polymerase I-like protein with 3'-5' exonuclease and polymerase domains